MNVFIIVTVCVFLLLIIAECLLRCLIRKLRKNFQWLITESDENPVFPREALNKFINSSFDQKLGWVRKPNTFGSEKGRNGDIIFHIDENGARVSSRPELTKQIAVFGDSYAFCRQVTDEETWEEGITKHHNVGVLNFGVGNYGADQALIRYQLQKLPSEVKVTVMCFVPETISRIQSYWKHYLEFGNTFAFKPRFAVTSDGNLELIDTIIKSVDDFENIKELLPYIQKHDFFYLHKFRKYQFRSIYLISFFRAFRRHVALIRSLLVKKESKISASSLNNGDAFALVMKDNIREAREMYKNPNAKKLLHAILSEFKNVAESRDHIPVILVIPQLLDFFDDKSKELPYSSFFAELSKEMNVIDMANFFRDKPMSQIYIDDIYGGHLSAEGNEIVAEIVSNWLLTTKLIKLKK